MTTVFQTIKRIPIQYPFGFGVALSTVKTSASDLLVQRFVEHKQEIDWRRNAAFAAFGCFYLGGVQYILYVPVFSRLFPCAAQFAAKPLRDKFKDVKGMASLVGQVFLDQCVHHPLFYFPAFYLTKEIVLHKENADFRSALKRYFQGTIMEDLTALWKIWIPSTIINFAFMPMWARIPWVAGTSFIWTCILSALRGGTVSSSDVEDLAGGNVTGATFKIVEEGFYDMFHDSVELDVHMSHICLTASGKDKVGWVSTLTKIISQTGGNIVHSKMVRLGQEFIILMHVSVKPEQRGPLILSLTQNETLKPLNINVSALNRRETGTFTKSDVGFRVHVRGEDKQGMVYAVADQITKHNLSVEKLTTELRVGRHGRRDFHIDADVVSTRPMDEAMKTEFVNDLTLLKKQLQLDVMDIRLMKGSK